MTVELIDVHEEEFGVEPVCEQSQIASSTHDAAKNRVLSKRAVRDAALEAKITALHEVDHGVCGARKM